MKQFLSVHDVPDVNALVQQALQFKKNPLQQQHSGKGKRLGLLFLNPSMRTRISTQMAAMNLGMEPVVFNIGPEGWALEFGEGAVMNGTTVEHVKDAAPVLGQYFDLLGIRTFPSLQNREEDYSEKVINAFVKYSGIPVISLESATLHPLQSFTDLITIQEHWTGIISDYHLATSQSTKLLTPNSELQTSNSQPQTKKPKIVLTWAPHVKALPQCVSNSFAQWITAWGEADFVITHPPGYELSDQFTQGAAIRHDQKEALQNADFVYVKNWSAYHDYGKLLLGHDDWMLTNKHLELTNGAKVMHCLPVRRNIELSDEVLDGPHSIVTQQAGNRVWAAQAVLNQILQSV